MRDPKIDPRPGDVLRKGYFSRDVRQVDSSFVWAGEHHREVFIRTVMPYLGQWRKWAKNAEVIHES